MDALTGSSTPEREALLSRYPKFFKKEANRNLIIDVFNRLSEESGDQLKNIKWLVLAPERMPFSARLLAYFLSATLITAREIATYTKDTMINGSSIKEYNLFNWGVASTELTKPLNLFSGIINYPQAIKLYGNKQHQAEAMAYIWRTHFYNSQKWQGSRPELKRNYKPQNRVSEKYIPFDVNDTNKDEGMHISDYILYDAASVKDAWLQNPEAVYLGRDYRHTQARDITEYTKMYSDKLEERNYYVRKLPIIAEARHYFYLNKVIATRLKKHPELGIVFQTPDFMARNVRNDFKMVQLGALDDLEVKQAIKAGHALVHALSSEMFKGLLFGAFDIVYFKDNSNRIIPWFLEVNTAPQLSIAYIWCKLLEKLEQSVVNPALNTGGGLGFNWDEMRVMYNIPTDAGDYTITGDLPPGYTIPLEDEEEEDDF